MNGIKQVECKYCGKLIRANNIRRHEDSHENSFSSPKDYSFKLNHEGLDCQFCGKTCKNRNSLCNHERLCKENPNKQESNLIRHIRSDSYTVWNKGLTKETSDSVKQHSESLIAFYEQHDGPWKGRKHTEEEKQKIGAGVKRFLEANPEMVPYKRNHSSKESYPELYFTDLFEAEGIKLEKQFPVKSYRLDFCDPDKKVAIEIDGEQHYVDMKMIDHDEKRDQVLTSLGWHVYRIRWSHFKSANIDKRKEIIEEIKKLL